MELEDIFLAKFADIGPDGLFTVVGGGISRINAAQFPWSWGMMYLLARIRLTREQSKHLHSLAIEREAPDGQVDPGGPESRMIDIPADAEPGPDGCIHFSLNYVLVNLVFPQPGVYKYRLKVDQQEIGAAKLVVMGPPQS